MPPFGTLVKKSNPNLTKLLGLTSIFSGNGRDRGMYYPHHHGDAISKGQILENSIAQTTWIISTKKFQGGEKKRRRGNL